MSPLLLLALAFSATLFALGHSHLSVPSIASFQDRQTFRTAQNDLSTTSTMMVANVTASTFSEENPVHQSLFGPLRNMVAAPGELEPYAHPRIIVGPSQWDDILSMYANPQTFNQQGTWSKFFRGATQNAGPNSPFLLELADLEMNGGTAAYDGRPFENSNEYQTYRSGLQDLANRIETSSASHADTFPICALWGSVALKQQSLGLTPFIDVGTVHTCIKAAVAWSKIVLAHRTYNCNPTCATSGPNHANLWDTERKFSLHHNHYLGGTGIGFTYDLLYDHISASDRVIMRSALAMFVMNRYAWGTSETSTRSSPNAVTDPHRIFSNWAGYNSNLYLANLAIEGEEGFDNYTAAVLAENNSSGFNQGLHARYSALLEAFMLHSFYPDGSSFEDGYSYFTALREGSLGLVASHRRGSNVLGSPRFRNIIHNAAQMHEPWYCGKLMGHASGGGIVYNAYVGLFRYVFPQGELPGMLWRQRFGVYQNNQPCRIFWSQSNLQLAFLGGEHSSNAESPEHLDSALQQHFKKSFYATRRGLLIARSSLSENATYMHFDARPDAFFLGHDNADRGVFTFTALRQTWLDDLPWSENRDSRKHSILHIDGLGQDMKAPSAKMLKVHDNGQLVLAAADLTYTYNTQWARDHNHNTPPSRLVTTYNESGLPSNILTVFPEVENWDPWTLGWPLNDRAEDIGFTDNMTLHGIENIGFQGIWMWKRPYRALPLTPLDHMVRSAALVRAIANDVGYGIIVDSVAAGGVEHDFESYLILHPSVTVDEMSSQCSESMCIIVLTAGGTARVDIHVSTLGNNVSYRSETFDGKKRLVVKSIRVGSEEFWFVLHPHEGTPDRIAVSKNAEGHTVIVYEGEEMVFTVNGIDYTVTQVFSQQSSPSPSATSSPIPTESASPSASGSPSPSVSVSPSHSASASPSSSSSLSATPTSSPSPTQSMPAGTLPMTAIALQKNQVVTESQMTSDSSQFFHSTDAPFQIVFELSSKSNVGLQLQDFFRTCRRATTVSTSLELFDCGDGDVAAANYQRRQCNVIENATVRSCRKYRMKMWATLSSGKKYYLAISMYPVKYPLALTIQHAAVSI